VIPTAGRRLETMIAGVASTPFVALARIVDGRPPGDGSEKLIKRCSFEHVSLDSPRKAH
jgi:hypothetical protein